MIKHKVLETKRLVQFFKSFHQVEIINSETES